MQSTRVWVMNIKAKREGGRRRGRERGREGGREGERERERKRENPPLLLNSSYPFNWKCMLYKEAIKTLELIIVCSQDTDVTLSDGSVVRRLLLVDKVSQCYCSECNKEWYIAFHSSHNNYVEYTVQTRERKSKGGREGGRERERVKCWLFRVAIIMYIAIQDLICLVP